MFTLVGYDKLAARTVQFWIDEAIKEGVNPDKILGAQDHHEAMLTFARDSPDQMKLPD